MFAKLVAGITPAQTIAVLGWIAAQAVAFGWLTNTNSQILVSGGATVIAAALKIADAHIQHGKAIAPPVATVVRTIADASPAVLAGAPPPTTP